MNFSAFIALWQHRFRKYSYIGRQYLQAFGSVVRFLLLKISFSGRKKLIVIIRTEHFGDIVAAEPIARQVRQLHPNDYIIWMVRPVFRELIDGHPAIDQVWLQTSVLQRILLCRSGVFDTVYNLEFWQSNRDSVSGDIHHNTVAARKDITVFNYFDKGNLLTIFQLCADLPQWNDTPKVYISEADRLLITALSLPKKLIVVHCNSNYPAKDWSVPNWEKLIKWLIEEKGYTVAEIGLKSNNSIRHPQYLNLCGQYSLLQTAEIIRRAEYFIGIDSGPAHLANAVGTYGLLLFGTLNNFDTYMPYSGDYQNAKKARLISKTGKTCAELDYDGVRSEIESILAKTTNKISIL
ncbi:MAG: glycosyltransferase family 9 protein [Spirosomataceae bacterium]